VETALQASTTLAFSGRDISSYYRLDDVTVAPVANPEPGTYLLLGTGVLALIRRRRRRSG
jgi:PEP-CTERM motif